MKNFFISMAKNEDWNPDEEELEAINAQQLIFETELKHLTEEYGIEHEITQQFLEDNK